MVERLTKGDGLPREGHEFRYRLASGFAGPGNRILDAACGTGYGLAFLPASQYRGVDRDLSTLEVDSHLRRLFIEADLDEWTPHFEFDVFVCFETLEHVKNPERLVDVGAEAKRWMLMSVPVVPTMHVNEFHLHDFDAGWIEDTMSPYRDEWEHYQTVIQPSEASEIAVFPQASMTTILTAIMGNYDSPKSFVPQTVPCRMLLVTDREHDWNSDWEMLVDEQPDGSPRLLAKRPKMFPWDYSDDGPWIWIDGSMEIKSATFAEEALASVTELGMWRHPARDCLYQEAAFSATLPKYQGQPLEEQAAFYMEDGFPRHYGLWAAGCIVYRRPVPRLSMLWMHENWMWTIQDQVSLPYAAHHSEHIPEDLPHHLLDNPWLHLHFHHDGTS